jgi:glycosyltransferase involved in cell wall biosynthesis
MDAPVISIAIPAYARPMELHRAISSVLDQGVAAVEVVVGDDSGDLEPVVKSINDDRVVYLRNETRLGMAGNWGSVLDHCSGSLIGLLMDDDELLPGFLPAVIDRFAAEPDLGVVFTNHVFADEDNRWPRSCALAEGRYDDFVLPLLRHRPVAVSATVMRSDVWQQVRPLPDLLTADMVMHLRIALAGYPFFYIDRPLMAYAVHPGQQSAYSPQFRQDQVRAWEMFRFDDRKAERLRRRYLARARVSVAAADLRQGRIAEARQGLAQARALGLVATGPAGVLLSLLARRPALALRALDARRQRSDRHS